MKLPAEDYCDNDGAVRRPMTEDRVPPIHERVVDYSEYMWMGEEMEEFDRQCIEQILEDEFIEDCFEEMLEEEDEVYDLVEWFCEEFEDLEPKVLIECMQSLALDNNIELTFLQDPTLCRRRHRLNPNAPEFVPSSAQKQASSPSLPPAGAETSHDR